MSTYTSIGDYSNVKILPKPSVYKLMFFYNFLNTVEVHANVDKTSILLDIHEKLRLGKLLYRYIINLFLDFLINFWNKIF